jgi:hypothetical protein
LSSQLQSKEILPEVACAEYVLLHLHRRHPRQWLSGPRLNSSPRSSGGLLAELERLEVDLSAKQSERLQSLTHLPELYSRFFFRGLVLDSHEGMVGWIEGRYPLLLRLDMPTPDEMLEIQCQGLRYVTLLLSEQIQFEKHGRHADACDFLLHDFEHAHKFYGDPASHRGQVRFFQSLQRSQNAFSLWAHDPLFKKELDYLKSDMNSHPVHLMKYLKAVVLAAEIRRTENRRPALDDFWQMLFAQWEMTTPVCDSALKINQPECETEQDLITVAGFFMPPVEFPCDSRTIDAK